MHFGRLSRSKYFINLVKVDYLLHICVVIVKTIHLLIHLIYFVRKQNSLVKRFGFISA